MILALEARRRFCLSDQEKLVRRTRIGVEAGLDPRYERRKTACIPTFGDAATKVLAGPSEGWGNAKYSWQSLRLPEIFVFPKLGERRVPEITMVRDVLSEIWMTKPERRVT